MPKIYEIDVIHTNGYVKIKLQNVPDYVLFDEEGFQCLLDLGIVPLFNDVQGAVMCRSNSRNIPVGRLLLDCQKNQAVRYLDFNIRNLRKSNLVKLGGAAKFAARSQITKNFERKVFQLRHVYAEG
jgi:hypothetical protein